PFLPSSGALWDRVRPRLAWRGLVDEVHDASLRWSALTALVLLLLTGHGGVAHAQPPTPVPAPAPGPIAVVQAFVDALNRHEPAAAAALFQDGATYSGALVCPQGCTGGADVAEAVARNWLGEVPLSVTLEQVSPTVVILRGQGVWSRANDRFSTVRFEMDPDT